MAFKNRTKGHLGSDTIDLHIQKIKNKKISMHANYEE